MKKALLRSRIADAEQQLAAAERALADVVGGLRAVPRAEKTVTTMGIESALDRVRTARANVSELAQLADAEDGDA